MSDNFFQPNHRHEKAPYGFKDDAQRLAREPCPCGYLAQGMLEMNRDLETACRNQDEHHTARKCAESAERAHQALRKDWIVRLLHWLCLA